MKLFVPQRLVKGSSKYGPHQSKKERIRRMKRALKAGKAHKQDDFVLSSDLIDEILRLTK